jgi:hypothetical protein
LGLKRRKKYAGFIFSILKNNGSLQILVGREKGVVTEILNLV